MWEECGWIGLYFLSNLSLTLHNKWILSKIHFAFPWTLSAIHILISGLGCFVIDQISPPKPNQLAVATVVKRSLTGPIVLKLMAFSILYAINIAISNISMALVDLSFHQLMRSATPACTLLLEWMLFGKQPAIRICISLVPVILGIALASIKSDHSPMSLSWLGGLLTVFGVVLASLKGITSVRLMDRMRPIELIWKMALPAGLQCLAFAWYFGELLQAGKFLLDSSIMTSAHLVVNASLAMLLNCISFTVAQKTSALTLTVAGNIKQALCIILAIYLFATVISPLNACGIVMSLAGGAWYSYECHQKTSLKH